MSIAVYRYSQLFEVYVFSGHDEQRRDFQVDEPTSLLEGVCKGHPFASSKCKAMKPPRDGVRDINVAQLFEF